MKILYDSSIAGGFFLMPDFSGGLGGITVRLHLGKCGQCRSCGRLETGPCCARKVLGSCNTTLVESYSILPQHSFKSYFREEPFEACKQSYEVEKLMLSSQTMFEVTILTGPVL
jgi:hypothetical protein